MNVFLWYGKTLTSWVKNNKQQQQHFLWRKSPGFDLLSVYSGVMYVPS